MNPNSEMEMALQHVLASLHSRISGDYSRVYSLRTVKRHEISLQNKEDNSS